MPTPLKIIQTGPQCAGKTECSKALGKRGVFIVHEAPLAIIKHQKKVGGDLLPWIRSEDFNNKIIELQPYFEATIPDTERYAVLDRSGIDAEAFLKFYNKPIPPQSKENNLRANYTAVLWLEILPEYNYWYETDSGHPRGMTYQEAKEIGKVLRAVYEEYNLPIHNIPALKNGEVISLEKRVDMIERKIKHLTQ